MRLSESTLKTIAKTIESYFSKQKIGDSEIHPPYLGKIGEAPTIEFSAIIQIYGAYRGAVYLTASRDFAAKVLMAQGLALNEENLLDIVGEMANIFAGNIRLDLGVAFSITPPVLMSGKGIALRFEVRDQPYVMPLRLDGAVANLVIVFEKS